MGSHGAEFDADFLDAIDETAKQRLAELEQTMTSLAQRYPGATVEIKPVSVAFHVRNAAPEQAQQALDEALNTVRDSDIHVTEGKAVREFAVIDTDKGTALDQLREQLEASAVVFFGDDVTDEKGGFARLAESDIGVKVGPGETKARYRVDSPDDVATALAYLLQARQD